MRRSSRSLIAFAAGFAAMLGTIAGVNYGVDPSQEFRGGSFEHKLADLLLHGQNATNVLNYNDRLLQRFVIEKLDKAPDTIVVGSSRSMPLSADDFPDGTFFNHSVVGGTIEDALAVWGLYRQRGLKPRRLVISLDHWSLGPVRANRNWRVLQEPFLAVAGSLGVSLAGHPVYSGTHSTSRAEILVSGRYFLSSLAALAADAPLKADPVPVDEAAVDTQVKRADGSVRWSAALVDQPPEQVADQAASFSDPLSGFDRLDDTSLALLEGFVRAIRAEGVDVVLLAAPFHPSTYQRFTRMPQFAGVLLVEREMPRIAERTGARLVGTYDPAPAGCGGADFIDATHPKHSCLQRLFPPQGGSR